MTRGAVLGLLIGLSYQSGLIAAQAPAWKPVELAGGTFFVDFPVEPKTMDQNVNTQEGRVQQKVYFCKVDGTLYTAQIISAPKPVAKGAEDADLDRQRKAQSAGSDVVSVERIKLDGYPGQDFTMKVRRKPGEGLITSRTKIFLANQSYYFFTAMSPIEKPLPEAATRFFSSISTAKNPGKPTAAAARASTASNPVAQGTPVEALRTFLVAMMMKDEATLRKVTLPTDDFDMLLKGQAPPAGQEKAIRQEMAKMPIKALKPGDSFEIPGRTGARKATVRPEEVGQDKAVLLPAGAPLPTRMERVDGRWMVDARPVIAGRKAAEAARKKAR